MPPISATLIDLLTYLAPGFVVLYGLRRQSDSIQKLFDAISSPHGTSALLTLAITAMAFGVIVAGISMLIVPGLARATTRNKTAPLHARQLDFLQLYTRPPETIQVFQHHSRVYQSYANMATALLVSLAILIFNLADHQPIDHWKFKLVAFSILTFLMFWAAARYFRILYLVGYALSGSPSAPLTPQSAGPTVSQIPDTAPTPPLTPTTTPDAAAIQTTTPMA